MTIEVDPDDYEFTFGKYKWCSYAEILKRDPGYILWLVEEGKFELEDSDLNELQDICNG
jgi:hypothetical protein